MNITAWIKATTGRAINTDGIFGAQCWDLWSDYAQRVVGVPYLSTLTRAGGVDPHPGWACNVFHNAGDALGEWFEIVPASRRGELGDVAFWEKGSLYPGSHVAIVLTDNGKSLTTHSQNPNLPRTVTIAKRDLLGYLRPRKPKPKPPAKTPAQIEEEELMGAKEDILARIEAAEERIRRESRPRLYERKSTGELLLARWETGFERGPWPNEKAMRAALPVDAEHLVSDQEFERRLKVSDEDWAQLRGAGA